MSLRGAMPGATKRLRAMERETTNHLEYKIPDNIPAIIDGDRLATEYFLKHSDHLHESDLDGFAMSVCKVWSLLHEVQKPGKDFDMLLGKFNQAVKQYNLTPASRRINDKTNPNGSNLDRHDDLAEGEFSLD